MKNPAKETLADKITGILNTTPHAFDPEEDAVDNTNARITFEESENSEEEEILSQFRKHNIDLLADVDEKYAGKTTSRRNLTDFSDNEDSSRGEESVVDGNEDDNKVESSEEGSAESGEENELKEVDSSEEESDFMVPNEDKFLGSKHTDTFKHINDASVSSQVKKGICVRNQMAMWENLLEIRIQLQKCLVTANKMPQNAKFQEIKSQSGCEFSKKVSEVKNTLCGTLDKLLLLQKLVLKQNPETRNLEKQIKEDKTEPDTNDEEILSDTEAELSDEIEEDTLIQSKKRKLSDYESDIKSHHKKYKNYSNDVIKKWYDKTKVVLKGGATSHSVLDQIEYNLNNNKDKLVKRTQLKRSQYDIVGENEQLVEKTEEVYNSEIFDDDDFYHQLLRELIEVKSADITDPIQLGRQWIQLQNLRSKMKRKIDTRATKGRKIRYAVHNKLVNFMAPIDEESWTDDAKTELYSSLFGKNQLVNNN